MNLANPDSDPAFLLMARQGYGRSRRGSRLNLEVRYAAVLSDAPGALERRAISTASRNTTSHSRATSDQVRSHKTRLAACWRAAIVSRSFAILRIMRAMASGSRGLK